jgi:hypothetical protein
LSKETKQNIEEEQVKSVTPPNKNEKFWWEVKDLLIGAAFPFIIMIVFSTTIMMFAGYDDLAVSIVASVGGEIMLIIAYIIFGKQNGAAAYRKYILGEKKRQLNSSDKRSIYKTGEYALWKGAVIGFITTIPFIILQTIALFVENSFLQFLLMYACGWAYFPFKFFGAPEAVNYVCIIIPVGTHILGYVLGKNKEIKTQQLIAEENEKQTKKRKKSK